MRNQTTNDGHVGAGQRYTESPDERRQGESIGDLSEVRSQASGTNAELKPGECRPATPEDAAKIKRVQEEWAKDPAKYADYAWEEV